MSPLYMIQVPIAETALGIWSERRNFQDSDFAMHCLTRECFGPPAPGPVQGHRERRLRLLGNARPRTAADIRDVRDSHAFANHKRRWDRAQTHAVALARGREGRV